MAEPVTEADLREKLLAVDRTSEEKLLGAHGHRPELEQWAQQHGFEIVDWVYENGVPGDTPLVYRRQLIHAFWRVQDEPDIAGIIFPTVDRQARETTSFEAMRFAAGKLGKHLFVGVPDPETGAVAYQDVAMVCGMELRRLRRLQHAAEDARTELLENAHQARRAKMNRGGNGGGFLRPSWFMDRVDIGSGKSEFAPNPQRLQWAMWMQERHGEGWTGSRIASELNRHGLTTTEGCAWTRVAVYKTRQQLLRIPDDIRTVWECSDGAIHRNEIGVP